MSFFFEGTKKLTNKATLWYVPLSLKNVDKVLEVPPVVVRRPHFSQAGGMGEGRPFVQRRPERLAWALQIPDPSWRALVRGKMGNRSVQVTSLGETTVLGRQAETALFQPRSLSHRVHFLPWFLSFGFFSGQTRLYVKRLSHVRAQVPHCRQARGTGIPRGRLG